MVAIQEKIQTFNQETEELQNVIVKGSDEHLDLVHKLASTTSDLTKKLVSINEDLFTAFNNLPKEEIAKTVKSLKDLLNSLYRLRSAIRNSALYPDIPQTYGAFVAGVEQMREITYDLDNFRLQDDDDIDSCLKELNEL